MSSTPPPPPSDETLSPAAAAAPGTSEDEAVPVDAPPEVVIEAVPEDTDKSEGELVLVQRLQLEEDVRPGMRLGRSIQHDPRSWQYPAPMASAIRSVTHKRRVAIFNQGSIGMCTGTAAIGCVSTTPFTHLGTLAESLSVYKQATVIDGFPGVYPPTDTGSSGLAVMKILKKLGLVTGYTHAFSLDQLLRALTLRPGIIGIAWRSGLDRPRASDGLARYSGSIRGGHEVAIVAIDATAKIASQRTVLLANSWGATWGYKGHVRVTWGDLEKALGDQGDATFPALPI